MSNDFVFHVPVEQAGGTHVDGAKVEIGKHAVTVDFIARDSDDPTGQSMIVVQRVRMDPLAATNLSSVLSDQMNAYRREFGEP